MLKKYLKIRRLRKLLKGSRYVKGSFVDYQGYIFHYPDQQSFAWTYLELFLNESYKFIPRSEKNDPIIIDCGANIGVSVVYFKKLFPKSKIIAFEPDPFLFKYLKKNIEKNGLKVGFISLLDQHSCLGSVPLEQKRSQLLKQTHNFFTSKFSDMCYNVWKW